MTNFADGGQQSEREDTHLAVEDKKVAKREENHLEDEHIIPEQSRNNKYISERH
jgi:hypothetical protein